MTENDIRDFKSLFKASILEGMHKAFKRDGCLVPIAFFYIKVFLMVVRLCQQLYPFIRIF